MVSTSTDICQNRKSEPNQTTKIDMPIDAICREQSGRSLQRRQNLNGKQHRIPRESLHDNSMRPLAVQAQVKTPNNSNSCNFYDAMMLSEAENRERRLPVV
jgi:hypothetical protein